MMYVVAIFPVSQRLHRGCLLLAEPGLHTPHPPLNQSELDRIQRSCAELGFQCGLVLGQAAQAPQRRDVMQRLAAQQKQLDAATAARQFKLMGTLGQVLRVLQLESAQLALSEEDYRTMRDRQSILGGGLV